MSIALSSIAAFAVAVHAARSVDLSAYTLRDGAVRDALLATAGTGAAVRVRLERDPLDDAMGSLHAANTDTITRLAAAGADAALSPAGSPVLHLKGAVVDGVAWLDDRNWSGEGPETVVRDSDADDVGALRTALAGGPGSDGHLRTDKGGAQALELDVIRAAGAAPLMVESESFGSGGVYSALLARGRAGLPTRLIVAAREAAQPGPAGDRERQRLATLVALGIAVRTGVSPDYDLDEKIAVTGRTAWVGSANATYARGPAGAQRDWGMFTREPVVVEGLRATLESNWKAARPFTDPPR